MLQVSVAGYHAIKVTMNKISVYPAPLAMIMIFALSFLTNVLNPKATLFFLGLFSLVVKPDTPYYILGILALIMILTAMGWFMIVALFFTQKAVQNAFLRFEKILNKVLGGLLVALGIKIATMLR